MVVLSLDTGGNHAGAARLAALDSLAIIACAASEGGKRTQAVAPTYGYTAPSLFDMRETVDTIHYVVVFYVWGWAYGSLTG